MKNYMIICLVFISFIKAKAQIDTTDWFPLQIGNYWEYAAITNYGPKYFSLTVIGDTLMPNGKTYRILKEKYINITGERYTWYLRQDTNKIYNYYGDSIACNSREYKFLDFLLPDSTVWKVCRDLYQCGNARGIAKSYYDYTYYGFLQKPLETKLFADVYIDSTDTTWVPCEGSIFYLAKGIGIVREFIFNDGDYWLQGAIINGVNLGIITSIEDEQKTIPDIFKIEAYPNPFNSTVVFKITLPSDGVTEITLYNIMGQKISTLLNKYKTAGSYSIRYNATHLSSGIYLIVLNQYNNYTIKKIILLK